MAILVVNRAEGFSSSTTPSLNTSATNHTTGNLIYVWINIQNSGAAVTITDTAGNTYIQIGSPLQENPGGGGGNWESQFYAKNITGNASNVINASWAGTPSGYNALVAYQVSGLDTVSPFVTSSSGTTSGGNPITTGTLTLTGSSIILGGMESDTQSMTPIGGYTLTTVTDGLGGYTATQYHVTSTSEVCSANGGGSEYIIIAAAFKAASGVAANSGFFLAASRFLN